MTVCAQAANQHGRIRHIPAVGARRQAESGHQKSSQAPLRPNAQFRNAQLNTRSTILLTFPKGTSFLMKTWIRKSLSVGVLAAGALLVASTAAQADVDQNSWDNNGVGNGIQIVSGVRAPLNIVGNAIGVAGEANAAGSGVNWTEGGHGVTQNSKDNNGALNGLQAYAPVWVPVNAVGNAVAVAGEANAAGSGVNKRTESARVTEGKHGDGDGVSQNSWDNNGVLNGAQLYFPIDIPINLCGNSIALLGEANAAAQCWNGGGWKKSESSRTEKSEQNTSDNNGALNGIQVLSGLHMPINLSGNAIGVLGEANAAAVSHNESGHGDGIKQNSSDNNGVANGLQVAAPVDIPINVCGNALGILGEANAAAQCSNGGHHHGGGNGGDNGNDDDYADDNGNDDGGYHHDDDNDDVSPDGGADGYTSTSDDKGGRKAHQGAKAHGKSAEASPVNGLTDGLTKGGNVPNVAGLNLLNTLG
jgi:ChpA-C